MTYLICMTFFGAMYAIKGGIFYQLFRNFERTRGKNKILDRLLDGKVLSTVLIASFSYAVFYDNWFLVAGIPLMWLASIAPSMGEEHGAVGDYKEGWGYYTRHPMDDDSNGRLDGIKKAVQRGVFIGACITLATGFTGFIVASLLFVPCIWVGQSLNRLVLRRRGWILAEPIIGALVYGIPMAIFISEVL